MVSERSIPDHSEQRQVVIVCMACGCRHHPGQICARANESDQTDGAACWCEDSFPVKVFRTHEDAIAAIVADLQEILQ